MTHPKLGYANLRYTNDDVVHMAAFNGADHTTACAATPDAAATGHEAWPHGVDAAVDCPVCLHAQGADQMMAQAENERRDNPLDHSIGGVLPMDLQQVTNRIMERGMLAADEYVLTGNEHARTWLGMPTIRHRTTPLPDKEFVDLKQRWADALTLSEVADKISVEYGEALGILGAPSVDPTVAAVGGDPLADTPWADPEYPDVSGGGVPEVPPALPRHPLATVKQSDICGRQPGWPKRCVRRLGHDGAHRSNSGTSWPDHELSQDDQMRQMQIGPYLDPSEDLTASPSDLDAVDEGPFTAEWTEAVTSLPTDRAVAEGLNWCHLHNKTAEPGSEECDLCIEAEAEYSIRTQAENEAAQENGDWS